MDVQLMFKPSMSVYWHGRMHKFYMGRRVNRPHWDIYERMIAEKHTAFRDDPPVTGIPVTWTGSMPIRIKTITEADHNTGRSIVDRLIKPFDVIYVELADARFLRKHYNMSFVPLSDVVKVIPDARFLAVRNRGLGDVMMAARAVATLKHLYPSVHITFATAPENMRVLLNHPEIDRVCTIDDMYKYDYDCAACLILYPEEFLIDKGDDQTKHRIDIFANALGLECADGKDLWYYVADDDIRAARDMIGDYAGCPLVGLQTCTNAGGNMRQWDPVKIQSFCDIAIMRGWKPVLLGYTRGMTYTGDIIDLRDKTTIDELGGVLSLCDVVVALDSGILHMARAIKSPIVALMDEYHSSLRMGPGDNAVIFDGKCWDYSPVDVADAVSQLLEGCRDGCLQSV